MPFNADQILAVFPHPVLTKIIGEPNLASITLQQSEHNGNLASIKSNPRQTKYTISASRQAAIIFLATAVSNAPRSVPVHRVSVGPDV